MLLPGVAEAHENGPPPGHTGGDGPDCTACHFDAPANSGAGRLSLDGIGTKYVAGKEYELILRLQQPGIVNGGFQLVARDAAGTAAGHLGSAAAGAQVVTDAASGMSYLQHAEPARPTADVVTWTARWQAPLARQTVRFDVAANAGNGDSSAFGDNIYTVSAVLEPAALSNESTREAPRFWRETRFNLRWAGAASNLSYITRYIAEGMLERLGRDTGYVAYGTRGNSTSENLYALGEHEVDFAITTPPAIASLAASGKAYFEKPYPDIRALAVFPQNDWVACVADARLGIDSFAAIRDRQLPVRVATNAIGRANGVSFLVEQLFRAHGIAPADIERWGGGFVEVPGAAGAARKVAEGEADIACHEYWKAFYRLTDAKAVTFLPVEADALDTLQANFGFRGNTIPKDVYGPGIPPRDIPAVDYSDWLVVVNANVPDDIAYLAAQVAVEDRERGYERIYWGLTDRQRSADIPVDPRLMWRNVAVPLHPGAERYYREAGLMD